MTDTSKIICFIKNNSNVIINNISSESIIIYNLLQSQYSIANVDSNLEFQFIFKNYYNNNY